MARLVITHGRSQEFGIPESLEREWVEALRWGLERAYAPFARDIPVSLTFYGDYWRVDAGEVTRTLDAGTASDLQRGVVEEILAAVPDEERGGQGAVSTRGGWDTVASLVGKLDGLPGLGEAALTFFLEDIDRYFDDEVLRDQAIKRIVDAVGEADDEVILLAHSLGSVVAYDSLRRHPELPVRGLVTFGSPLGLDTVRARLEATGGDLTFPPGVAQWANIYEPRDPVAANRGLAGVFPSTDGREVVDTRSKGRRPGVLKLIAAHDALVYLSSAALGTATRTMVEEVDGERSAMAMPESAQPEGSDPGWADSARADDAFASAADDAAGVSPDDGAVASVDGDAGYSTGALAGSERDAAAIPPGAGAGSSGAEAERAEEDAAASRLDHGDRAGAEPEPASPPVPARRAAPRPGAQGEAGQRSRSRGARRGIPIDRDLGPVGSHPATSGSARGPAVSPSGEALREVETSAAASFPPVVAPGSVHRLAFEVGRAASGDVVTPISTSVPAAAETLDLTVLVQAPNFEVVDPETNEPVDGTATISLALDTPDALVTGEFHLRAEGSGERVAAMIRLRFLHDNTPIGTIRITTLIDAQSPLDQPAAKPFGGHIHYDHRAPQGAELLLLVNRDDDGTYQITATLHGGLGRSIPRAKLGSFPVTGEAWEYAKALLEKFKDTDSLPEADREERINNLGLDLWRKLPDAFRAFYWEHVHDGVETILVCSEEPYIPWELIKPERSVGGEAAPMLGQAFAMARWDDERQIPNPIEVDDFVVIAPTYVTNPLPSARQEATELVSRFGANWVDPGNRTQVVDLLKSPSLQVLHFSGHGEFNNTPDESRIALADIPLDIIDVNGARFAQNVEPPLIFLNACEVGSQGWSLTQIGGWAEAFCGAGCAAFIGPYWAVSDRVAFKAAMRFYSGLQHGMTVGEAMQEIRDQFYDDAEDRFHPSWLAYSLHCHPNVTVRI